jgi:hypothetical protein
MKITRTKRRRAILTFSWWQEWPRGILPGESNINLMLLSMLGEANTVLGKSTKRTLYLHYNQCYTATSTLRATPTVWDNLFGKS